MVAAKRANRAKSLIKKCLALGLACLACALAGLVWQRDGLVSRPAAPKPTRRQDINYFQPAARLTGPQIEAAARARPVSDILAPGSSKLFNLSNVSYLIEPSASVECELAKFNQEPITLLIVVNSRATNFGRRQRMRATWLNARTISRQLCALGLVGRVEFLFALGVAARARQPVAASAGAKLVSARHAHALAPTTTSRLVAREAHASDDLLVINLEERYRNMSLKHLAIFKWLVVRRRQRGQGPAAPNALELLLKCDDDAQLDLGQLLAEHVRARATSGSDSDQMFANNTDGGATSLKAKNKSQNNWLFCAQFPANTRALRHAATKWHLSQSEWPFDTFPAYCSGLAYLTSLQVVEKLLIVAHLIQWNATRSMYTEPLWIDDVYVTGVLLGALAEPVRVHRLNAHFCYTGAQRWRRKRLTGRPCMAAELYH